MAVEVRIPELGESIADGVIVRWIKQDGEAVRADEPLLELETDKATVEIPAPAAGRLEIAERAGATVRVGAVVGRIAEDAGAPAPRAPADSARGRRAVARADAPPPGDQDTEAADDAGLTAMAGDGRRPAREAGPRPAAAAPEDRVPREIAEIAASRVDAPPEEREEGAEEPVPPEPGRESSATGRRPISPAAVDRAPSAPAPPADGGEARREPMSRLRRRIAERLVEAQRTAAILTTFNEIDCSRLLDARRRHRERFRERHGVDLGLMSFFARASVLALADVPIVNARIDGDDVVHHGHVHLGIAVSTPRGLVVPVVRDAHRLDFAGLERAIEDRARLARDGKLAPDDLAGGTFTITNGGVFGSLLSTPILNPPQSGILGMHKIEDRPIAVDGQVVIRPMMYVALSYDHRLVDGEQAVTFLVRVKERLEDLARMLFEV